MTDGTVSEASELSSLVAALDDEHVRTILAATSDEPRSANELSELCDVSVSTVYRRVERLTELDLLAEQTRPRADGHHDTVYAATLERFELTVSDGELDWSVDRRGEDVADQLSRLWGNF
ncbi:ArsR/SmtB family transcription factor [Haloarcula litorea]|uniref:ArsR/SmtB family transcription factor n=1 Tax=Haloarcula litorea TaxID=3032579 RepID=UPI003AF31E4A